MSKNRTVLIYAMLYAFLGIFAVNLLCIHFSILRDDIFLIFLSLIFPLTIYIVFRFLVSGATTTYRYIISSLVFTVLFSGITFWLLVEELGDWTVIFVALFHFAILAIIVIDGVLCGVIYGIIKLGNIKDCSGIKKAALFIFFGMLFPSLICIACFLSYTEYIRFVAMIMHIIAVFSVYVFFRKRCVKIFQFLLSVLLGIILSFGFLFVIILFLLSDIDHPDVVYIIAIHCLMFLAVAFDLISSSIYRFAKKKKAPKSDCEISEDCGV